MTNHRTMPYRFLFATGIENSAPTINNGKYRMDELEKCAHYKYWQKDFELVQEMEISFLRYGPPIHRCFLGENKYDWEFADITFKALRQRKIIPIVDLCRICRCIRQSLPLGTIIYTGERNVHLCTFLRVLRMVERTTYH